MYAPSRRALADGWPFAHQQRECAKICDGGQQVAARIERPAEGIADFLETVATIIVEVSSLSSNQHSWQNNARFNRALEREGSVGSCP